MLKRCRSEVCIYNVTWLIVHLRNPFGKLHRVRDCCGEENISNLIRKKDNGLFPDYTSGYMKLINNRVDKVGLRNLLASRM